MDLNSEESLLLTSMVNTNIYADVLKKNKACQIYEYMYLIFLLFYREIWRIDLEQQLDFLFGYHATNVNFTSVW